jgi:hypothetical protein
MRPKRAKTAIDPSPVAVARDAPRPARARPEMGSEAEGPDRPAGEPDHDRGAVRSSAPLANVSKRSPARDLSRPYDGRAERAHYACGSLDVYDVERANVEKGERRRAGRPVKYEPPAHVWIGRCAACNGFRVFSYAPAWQPDLFREADRRRRRRAPSATSADTPSATSADAPALFPR